MWAIETTDTFDEWFDALGDTDRANVLASMLVLQERGPMLSRPYADTVNGSSYNNMKELRVQSKGDPIRAFFAFDPKRKGIILCAGNKAGDEKRFYDIMISIADREFSAHLAKLEKR
ncbi:type II toxin-antitoxin system RelE/ParE family toxin [Neptunicella marina]|uniref:Type II toxin-antitoxin system RelE/ParE family toxin n=1 Tax=Neptunicella marina TaxID=2125989 RepID=A0A8J6M3T1_9ALTE|nr:type II toxin-antitoxin system RelE/ParE family toxin [Neptunicella marina]MBC3767813.1 type II toxin-antitoxin system RelE/ParE family toxin [Neptunicella marina]